MKNKSKKIPKTHLPKYGNGGDATSNLYNDKRSNSLTTDQKNSIYSTLGAAGTSYAMSNNQAAYSDPNYQMNNSSKGAWQSQGGAEGTADAIQSGVASAIPQAALFHGISESAQSAIGTQGANAGAQYFFEPHKLITHAIDGEGLFNAKDREEHGLGKLNGGIRFANGGMNMQPNAEIEKQENVVAPNGGFLQADGPSHEQGGVPVKLPGNSLIFSDRLKAPGTKKTFADLNKINNTNKEDKILDSNKTSSMSKRTAELMKFVKNKNSETLFNEQEALKQAKVEAYAKKMGVNLNQSPEAPQEFAMGGVKLPMYNYGGPTDNTKFTPAQRQQAYTDSMTLYKSGFNKNIPNWKTPGFNEAVDRLKDLNGVAPQSTDRSSTAYANDANYLAQRSVPYAKPTAPVIQTPTVKTKPVYGNFNMPMKGLENNVDINPQLQTVPANSPSTLKTNIVTTPNYSYKDYKDGNELVDRRYFDNTTKKEIELDGFKYGGRKLPKYEFGKLTPEEEGDNLESVWNNSSAKIDAQHGWDSNDETTRPGYRKQFDWQGLGSNIAMGLANNAGNIYNLSRYNKPEIEKYERMKATFLDPSAALRDAEAQTRRAEYNVRGASGGNAGTYLSNRVALNAQNTMNKARIHNEFQNANAGIANSVGQYNNELARQEVIANAMNRARTRSGKGEAIGSMGYNIANQMMDNKKTNMDQETLQLMMKYYNDPQFKKYLEESGFNKKKTGK